MSMHVVTNALGGRAALAASGRKRMAIHSRGGRVQAGGQQRSGSRGAASAGPRPSEQSLQEGPRLSKPRFGARGVRALGQEEPVDLVLP